MHKLFRNSETARHYFATTLARYAKETTSAEAYEPIFDHLVALVNKCLECETEGPSPGFGCCLVGVLVVVVLLCW